MHPEHLIEAFGALGLFAIAFAEPGLLFGFFLPGDSLLFTSGLVASRGDMDYRRFVTYEWSAGSSGAPA